MIAIQHAHETLGHTGPEQTGTYLRQWYWFPKFQSIVDKYCNSCATCTATKPSNKNPAGKLHGLPIPTLPWQSIAMDFVGPFPPTGKFNYLWVILCYMTSMVHLVPCSNTTTTQELVFLFLSNIICLHEIPDSIVSD